MDLLRTLPARWASAERFGKDLSHDAPQQRGSETQFSPW